MRERKPAKKKGDKTTTLGMAAIQYLCMYACESECVSLAIAQ